MPKSYEQLCPVACGLDVFGDRWTMVLVRDLLYGPRRFGELLEGNPGIARNLLTRRLRELETAGLVSRRLLSPWGQTNVYELSEAGRDLRPILEAMAMWSMKHLSALPINMERMQWLVGKQREARWEKLSADDEPPASLGLEIDGLRATVIVGSSEIEIVESEGHNADAVLKSDSATFMRLLGGFEKLDDLPEVEVTGDPDAADRVLGYLCYDEEHTPLPV